ncbi:dihydrodipicolinate synthetase [Beutenbergia cavernae DSM 12333]|uniref:Dihydrodipicolinate synthetase n=1 Tax=Beutenbergia cavernae (strain ATCC BAA-8 / DSM 12333 / CCUG 43141 / JCM 11478 / NBRC 16432 / NCIMB 13614 / HKI 0122) TaxID=471853 RepID=C5C1I4_BEUC1|nr:dihydrodipicolinate synthase family protein [Beutenbergia cavernae]ACQ81594.1 dihydrodipicolinate synthetase [Beutenbergia cavernae DSM 12333]
MTATSTGTSAAASIPARTAAPSATADAVGRFRAGGVIPAHPLALTAEGRIDERRQRALSRYYVEAGSLGLAVAVHTTQFAVHDPARGLLAPVLELAAETVAEYPERDVVLVAGLSGPTEQAVAEAELAASLGYDLCLLAPHGVGDVDENYLLERARAVGEVLPVIGFYLQLAVGGRYLSRDFWRRLADVPSVVGIKAAPFDRYATLDVVHGLASSQRGRDVALYTGNDDHIVMDLLTSFTGSAPGGGVERYEMVGGLLGQWAVWVREAVRMHGLARAAKAGDGGALAELLRLNPALTDANGVLFDAANAFVGCIAGVHEVLRRQGLLGNLVFLDPREGLSPGQLEEIDRIWRAYPELRDDAFVAENLDRWLR